MYCNKCKKHLPSFQAAACTTADCPYAAANAKVVSINAGASVASVNAHLISALKDIIQMAEEGRLMNFIGCGFTTDNHRLALWSDGNTDTYNVWQMLGSLRALEYEYVERHPMLKNQGQQP